MRFNSEVYNKVYHPEPEDNAAQVRAHLTKPEKEKKPEEEAETPVEEAETPAEEEPETPAEEEPETPAEGGE